MTVHNGEAENYSEQRFRFLDLPIEIRIQVYQVLWESRREEFAKSRNEVADDILGCIYYENKANRQHEFTWSYRPGTILWPFACTCKTVYYESRDWLRKDVQFFTSLERYDADIYRWFHKILQRHRVRNRNSISRSSDGYEDMTAESGENSNADIS